MEKYMKKRSYDPTKVGVAVDYFDISEYDDKQALKMTLYYDGEEKQIWVSLSLGEAAIKKGRRYLLQWLQREMEGTK